MIAATSTQCDVLSLVKKLKPLLRSPVLLKNVEPSVRGEGINPHNTHDDHSSKTGPIEWVENFKKSE